MTNLIPRLSEVIDADLIAQGKGLDGIDAEMIAEGVLNFLRHELDRAYHLPAAEWIEAAMGRCERRDKSKLDKPQLGIDYDV